MRGETIPGFGGSALALLALAALALHAGDSHAQTYETRYAYVEEAPEWAPHADGAMDEAIQYWKDRLPAVKLRVTEDQEQADFRVQWVKEFGAERAGFALGAHFVEVGLGDSDCNGVWSPYSSRHVAEILEHEIGHVLGYEHSDDWWDVMHPVALNREYGPVELEMRTAAGYGHFVVFCTSRDVSSFDYRVSIDDPAGGLHVYAVPDGSALDRWIEGEPFRFYAGASCFGEDYQSYAGSCDGMFEGSGLLILSPDALAEPLAWISVRFEETEQKAGTIVHHEGIVRPQLGSGGPAEAQLAPFEDPTERYAIRYPES